jgi:hypothetical protein
LPVGTWKSGGATGVTVPLVLVYRFLHSGRAASTTRLARRLSLLRHAGITGFTLCPSDADAPAAASSNDQASVVCTHATYFHCSCQNRHMYSVLNWVVCSIVCPVDITGPARVREDAKMCICMQDDAAVSKFKAFLGKVQVVRLAFISVRCIELFRNVISELVGSGRQMPECISCFANAAFPETAFTSHAEYGFNSPPLVILRGAPFLLHCSFPSHRYRAVSKAAST